MCREAEELENMINQMRKKLIVMAKETGLNSNCTLWYSQKLDKLIASYQRLQTIQIHQIQV
ncbi:aspartyl-phosphate phosphatase Spo0E family protein [Neobacillus cucumis]|uniref:aspartyl-phosphate phosphatase Spo0E family protein n=1 Tax=Neobacillus cucumis TaxID=1740721 RepID=UPI002E1DB24D|nr:aspartyl-phosphate phosphatase Spo0E family protein [Neobacillus cucumis]